MRKTANSELGRPTPEEFASQPRLPVTVVLDGVRSLSNVGSVFRTCDAFAVKKILLCGVTGTPPDREIHKTALGAEQTVPWEYFPDATAALARLRKEGAEIVAVEQVEDATLLQDFTCERDREYALVFGNEVFGVSEAALGLCDSAVEIPQSGTKHSLNVSVSAGVVLWHFYADLYI